MRMYLVIPLNYDFDKYAKAFALDLDFGYSIPVYFRLPYELKKVDKDDVTN